MPLTNYDGLITPNEQSCIFLLGGRTKAVEPMALRLNSGDVVVMTGEARRCFHGVPKILEVRIKLRTSLIGDAKHSFLRQLEKAGWKKFLVKMIKIDSYASISPNIGSTLTSDKSTKQCDDAIIHVY